ncbi:hypothetical protein Acsp02_97410 [Actinoplanes sp. NBRC 103695]|nr:hypothetical protein Acsp02_97410 [Actinoplanes sp. NBRC 103695]
MDFSGMPSQQRLPLVQIAATLPQHMPTYHDRLAREPLSARLLEINLTHLPN